MKKQLTGDKRPKNRNRSKDEKKRIKADEKTIDQRQKKK